MVNNNSKDKITAALSAIAQATEPVIVGYAEVRCRRCNTPLEDAASREIGVGPICRKIDNVVMARLIPADMPRALELAASVDPTQLPLQTVKTWGLVLESLIDSNGDHRKAVKRVEWMLSHQQTGQTAEALMQVVSALGYLALVAVWRGEASTGKSAVWMSEGRLYLAGSRCQGGKAAMKAIRGWSFQYDAGNPYTQKSCPAWSVPVMEWEAFAKAVATHWPNVRGGNLEELVAAAAQTAQTMKAAQPKASGKVVRVIEGKSGALKIIAPYSQTFLDALHARTPEEGRKWMKDEKAWIVAARFAAQIEPVIAEAYQGYEIERSKAA
jgi:RecA/RadA recombinase